MLNFNRKKKVTKKNESKPLNLVNVESVKNLNEERKIETVYPNDPAYKLFKRVEGNRELSISNYNNLKASIQKQDLTKDMPILISPDGFDIYDGQHRYEVCVDLGLPITFIKAHRKYSVEEIIMLNSCNKKWEVIDRVHSWSRLGKPDFKRMEEDMEKFNLSPNEIIMACHTSWGIGTSFKINIKNGILKYGESQRQALHITLDEMNKIMNTLNDSNLFNGQKFFSAYCRLRSQPGYQFKRFLHQVDKYMDVKDLKRQRTRDDVFARMLEVYNYKRQDRLDGSTGEFKPRG